MKKTRIILILSCVILFTAGKPAKENAKMVTVTENNIQSTFGAKPDATINFKKVFEHYKQFPERWNSTFRFLTENDLSKLPLGRIDLSEDVYVAVSEYTTKNPENALYESHKKYIDLQYIVSGNEYIGLTNDIAIPVTTPYNEQKDIAFYTFNGGELLLANPTKYFIFFPEDIHRPCVKVDNPSFVRKVVVKIKL